MAHHEKVNAVTAIAGTAILADRFVVIASDGQADHAGTAQVSVDGISGNAQPTVGSEFPMVVADGSYATVEAGAAVAVGALVATDNVGRAITFVDAAANVAVGKCVGRAALNAGEKITIHFIHKRTGAGS